MNPTPVGVRGAYDATAAAVYLSESVDTVNRLIREGLLTAYYPMGKERGRRITRDELDRYIAASVAASHPTLEAVKSA